MHYYQFNIGDYRRDTSHLSRLEHSIYRDLIDWYYLEEYPIPLETHVVMRRLRLATDDEANALKNVLSDFFTEADGWRHSRIDQDIREYHSMAEKNKINGKLGGRPKKTQSVSSGLPDETQSKGNQEPITTNQEPNIKPPSLREAPPREKKSTFKAWLAEVALAGEKPISSYRPVFEYAKTVGLSDEWIQIAWIKFSERYTKDKNHSGKRYIDWRQTFLNAIKDNWFKLWYAKEGVFMLTTVGIQTDIETREVA